MQWLEARTQYTPLPGGAGDALPGSPSAQHFCLAEDTLPTQVSSIAFYLPDEVWIGLVTGLMLMCVKPIAL